MSKSDKSKWSRIEIADSADVVSQKIMKAVSDSTPEISYDPNERPAVSNLVCFVFIKHEILDINIFGIYGSKNRRHCEGCEWIGSKRV